MAQGDFTKEEADETLQSINELFRALPKKKEKQVEYLALLNDVCLFIEAAKRAATA